MRVVVTGGAGFIGANLASALVDRGHEVVVVDDLSTGSSENLRGLNLELVEGTILGNEARPALESGQAIVHLAAVPSVPRSVKEPVISHEANATGTLRVLEAARHNGAHVVVASSSSVYGANPALPKREDMRPMPVSPYAVSKLAAESYAVSYQRCYGLPTLAFRFFNVFGPLQAPDHAYAAVVPAFAAAALRGDPLVVHGDGSQTRDFTYVGTVVETICSAIDRKVASLEPVNLAFGTRFSLLEVISLLERELGAKLTREHTDTRAGDVKDSQADSAALRALFPDVNPVELAQGLAETVSWMRTRVR
ncbi:NAD-dependent epimerase/dehydratase family protein [Nocardioides sp. HDW12B]|uniref:NAD-dependent epimerase/dehydratase family protein n=1 Tax=Nocardioides sp. HDW12B TaxID=2714939 RepID=UPI00140A528D|nr:NAD-dependent epimerase/dehydratase family protein [Nocardioides sp. HDW12B]QIK64958.1 NAD-dependent epimerase/dehydratase family protein [Nocardioides sp. HDW12B]